MPPVECLNLLSDIYDISINEILAGERASGDNFTEIAEKILHIHWKKLKKKVKVLKIVCCAYWR